MNQAQGTQPKKSSLGLVIVIIVVVLIVLGVGGYFGWKYLGTKIFNRATTKASPSPVVTVTVTASPSTALGASPTATLSASKAISGDYVINDSASRVIQEVELVNLTPWQLKVARNEIYARHGRPFVHKDLQCYFATKSWYSIDPNFSESSLSTIENRNVAIIQAYEEKIGSPMASQDTGC
jgi:hypothetical protein